MAYHNWIFNKQEIAKIWAEKYRDKVGVPQDILSIENDAQKEQLSELWQFIHVNFKQEELEEGFECKVLRTAMFKYITENYYENMNGVNGVIKWFASKNLLNLFNRQVEEEFIKKNKK